MNDLRQVRLVAVREIKERGRSRAFRWSLVAMVLVVAAMIVLPGLLQPSRTKDIGVTGSVPAELSGAIRDQGRSVRMTMRLHHYATVAEGERAVRNGKIDALVVDAQRLEWRRRADEQLRALLTGAIQLVAVRQRAAAAGIDEGQLAAVMRATPVKNVELGAVTGRGRDDETVALIMTVVLLFGITTYGSLVLTGVVEEKSSRVIEVLLARTSARALLAGKVAGIGFLGLAQIGVTALVAFIAVSTVNSVDLPAVRSAVLVWVVVWFVLGFALYAMVFGALGSLASRAEDAQGLAGPASIVLIAGYAVSFAAIGSPDKAWARFVSVFPATAPLAMPGRIAMGAAAWWEPIVGVIVTLAAIAALVEIGGRVYVGAILRTGPTLKVRDAWRSATTHTSIEIERSAPTEDAMSTNRTGLAKLSTLPMYQWVLRAGMLGGAFGFIAGHGIGVAIGITVGLACGFLAGNIAKAAERRINRHHEHPASDVV